MAISANDVKDLRDRTGAGMMDCKKALQDTGGDMEKAVNLLREKGIAVAAKRESRAATEGVIEAYIHIGGQKGAMVELSCETSFVAKTDEFKALAHDIVMQIAWSDPRYISRDEIPEAIKNTFDKLGIPEAERKFLAGVGAGVRMNFKLFSLRLDWAKAIGNKPTSGSGPSTFYFTFQSEI